MKLIVISTGVILDLSTSLSLDFATEPSVEIVLAIAWLHELGHFFLLLLAVTDPMAMRHRLLLLVILFELELSALARCLQLILLILPIELDSILIQLIVNARRPHFELFKQILNLIRIHNNVRVVHFK